LEGERKVLVITYDDYLELSSVIESYFPKADNQLCIVHFLRNLKKRLSPERFKRVKELIDAVWRVFSLAQEFGG